MSSEKLVEKFNQLKDVLNSNIDDITSVIVNQINHENMGNIKSTVIKFPGWDSPRDTVWVESTASTPIEIISNEQTDRFYKSPAKQKRTLTKSPCAIKPKQRKIAFPDEIYKSEGPIVSNENLYSINKQTRTQIPLINDKSKQKQSRKLQQSTKAVPKGTQIPCKSNKRIKLTLQRLSTSDRLCLALSKALGERPLSNGIHLQRKKRDPYCWQCHEKTDENGGDKGCQFCQISFCQKCLDAKEKPSNTKKQTQANVPPTQFPTEMPKMEPECDRLTLKWRKHLADKNVCHNCVDRVAEAIFNRTLGLTRSDYEREVNSPVFCDAVGVLIAKAAKENKNKIVCFNSLIKVSQNGHPKDVVVQMTLKMIENKAENHEYRSTKDFLFDINLILHNLAIEKGVSVLEQRPIWKIHFWLKRELQYVDMCATCYRNFYITPSRLTKDCGFEEPCGNPHSIVWAKYLDKYWFPAKVFECRLAGSFVMEKDEVYVQFFGKGDIYLYEPQKMKTTDLYLYSKKKPPQVSKLFGTLQKTFENSQNLVKEFLRLLNLFYDNQYKVPEEPEPLTDSTLYIPNTGRYHEKRVLREGFFTQKSESSVQRYN